MLLGLVMADHAAGSSPQKAMMTGIMPCDPADHRTFQTAAAGAGVELDATAVTTRATVTGIRNALIVDTYQRFRDVVFNVPSSIRVP